eukprot:COSAG01_NODE_5526_length_4205_cov_3.424744_4_plen_256_part_00
MGVKTAGSSWWAATTATQHLAVLTHLHRPGLGRHLHGDHDRLRILPIPNRVRRVSIFLGRSRRYIGKSQSKRPPKRTQRTPHQPCSTARHSGFWCHDCTRCVAVVKPDAPRFFFTASARSSTLATTVSQRSAGRGAPGIGRCAGRSRSRGLALLLLLHLLLDQVDGIHTPPPHPAVKAATYRVAVGVKTAGSSWWAATTATQQLAVLTHLGAGPRGVEGGWAGCARARTQRYPRGVSEMHEPHGAGTGAGGDHGK